MCPIAVRQGVTFRIPQMNGPLIILVEIFSKSPVIVRDRVEWCSCVRL